MGRRCKIIDRNISSNNLKILKKQEMENLIELTGEELMTIDGGRGFWGDLAYGVFYAIHSTALFMEQNAGTIRPSEYR